jgi:hypothetical protein
MNVGETWNDPPSILYWYTGVPPAPTIVTCPSELPKQVTFVCEEIAPERISGCVIVTGKLKVHKLASRTVIE